MRPRLIAILCAPLALFTIYCDQTVGGGLQVNIELARDGSSCVNNAGCYSFNCVGAVCAAPASGFIEVDGDCTGGGSCVPNTTCTGGICVQTSGWCVPDGTPCSSTADCCNLNCSGTNGAFIACGAPAGTGAATTGSSSSGSTGCAGQGVSCGTSSDCCMQNCDPEQNICCFGSGLSCSTDADCCNGFCDTSEGLCD